MELTVENINTILEKKIRPRVRLDGGEIEFEKIEGTTISFIAKNECATCPATTDGLKWWLGKELTKAFNQPVTISIRKEIPYFNL